MSQFYSPTAIIYYFLQFEMSLATVLLSLIIALNIICNPVESTVHNDPWYHSRVTSLRNTDNCNKYKLPEKVLILDIDNCLYSESEIQGKSGGQGIEKQIIQNTYDFGKLMLNLTEDDCDKMYQQYGSTIEGIRHKLISEGLTDDRIHDILHNYYLYVYDRIDMTCLLPNKSQTLVNTGYNHASVRSRQMFIREMLQRIPYPIYFASNSPRRHVLRVLSAMGLKNVDYDGLLTPDVLDGPVKFPTKFQPVEFFRSLLEIYGSERLILIDDSKSNIQRAKEVGIQGILVNNDKGVTLEEALSIFVGHVEQKSPESCSLDEDWYEFSDVKYLQSKYNVDMEAINPRVWDHMMERLLSNHDKKQNVQNVRIVDIGAGLLSMLDLMIVGIKEKRSLIGRMESGSELHYIAYESNKNLLGAIDNRLRSLGFENVKTNEKDEYEYILQGKVTVKLTLRVKDFTQEQLGSEEHPHMILGCCFADLFDPDELVVSVARFVNYYKGVDKSESQGDSHQEILLYFPITFCGTTQFVKPRPFEVGFGNKVIPSDTMAFRLYSQNLIEQYGHNLDPRRLIEAFQNVGVSLLDKGQSVWHIDPIQNTYLWKTMLHFFRNSAAFEIMKLNLDSVGWLQRAERTGSPIRVMNQDLLFSLQLPFTKKYVVSSTSEQFQEVHDTVEEIVFMSPYEVGKNVKGIQENHLEPNEVEVKSICSLISSGTELKIFKGLFDEAQLDVNIKGMAEETMKYPLSYGYSLVGIVTRCGSDVADSESLMGKMVFTFSPHSTHAIVDRRTVHIVPDGISAEDAIFLPSVETALSIVHDANIRVGERVSVYGQGLIGLLVTGILSRLQPCLNHSSVGTITTFDTIGDRLAMSSAMGSSQALLPCSAKEAGPFDVSIEVSGNARALQSAIDATQDGGRIIVGSWYGNSEIQLKLGIDFHRSHKTIKTSQVSTIPAELSALWSKEKRFILSWELVRLLKPSNLITRWSSLDNAQESYELLDSGKEIAISFQYKT